MSQLAKRIVDITTGEETDNVPEPSTAKQRAAKGGYARAAKLTPEERSAIAKKAARARWAATGKEDAGED